MSTQGGKGTSNTMSSSGISGWFFNTQDKNTGGGSSNGSSNPGGGGSSMSNGNSNNNFMSVSKSTQDWQSGRNVNIWMPQSL